MEALFAKLGWQEYVAGATRLRALILVGLLNLSMASLLLRAQVHLPCLRYSWNLCCWAFNLFAIEEQLQPAQPFTGITDTPAVSRDTLLLKAEITHQEVLDAIQDAALSVWQILLSISSLVTSCALISNPCHIHFQNPELAWLTKK